MARAPAPAAARMRLAVTPRRKSPPPSATPMRCSHKAPAVSFEQRWSVWNFGGSQTTDWGCHARLQYRDLPHRRHRGGRGYSHFFRAAGLCARRRRTQFCRQRLRQRSLGPVQAERSCATLRAPPITGALVDGWQDITTDRTVTVGRHRRRAARQRLLRRRRRRLPFSLHPGLVHRQRVAAGQFTTFDFLPAYGTGDCRDQHLCAGLWVQGA